MIRAFQDSSRHGRSCGSRAMPSARPPRDPLLPETVIPAVREHPSHVRILHRHDLNDFATHLIEHGYDIRSVRKLFGNKDVRARMVYAHVRSRGSVGVRSCLDRKGLG